MRQLGPAARHHRHDLGTQRGVRSLQPRPPAVVDNLAQNLLQSMKLATSVYKIVEFQFSFLEASSVSRQILKERN